MKVSEVLAKLAKGELKADSELPTSSLCKSEKVLLRKILQCYQENILWGFPPQMGAGVAKAKSMCRDLDKKLCTLTREEQAEDDEEDKWDDDADPEDEDDK